MKVSVVAPIFNEEDSVAELHEQIMEIFRNERWDGEVIFVNDGSTDDSLERMRTLKPLKIVNLRRNYGQTAAFDTGFKEAQGEYVVTIDGDLQNDPRDIPRLIRHLEEHNLDVVSGWRKNRRDNVVRRVLSWGADLLRRVMVNDYIRDSGCSLKVYRRECLEGLELYGETHRFIPAILAIKGYKIGELPVNHRPRTHGKTKYGVSRLIKGVLDLIAVWFWKKFVNRPLHLFGGVGVVLMAVSVAAGVWALYEKIAFGLDLSDTALTQVSLFGFLIGIQFFVFGLLADMLTKTYFASRKESPYSVASVIDNT